MTAATTAHEPAEHDRVPAPAAELRARVARLRRRGAGQLDRTLLVVGGVLLPLGVLVVVLGWLGTSHTVLLFEQIPYLVSGGLLGLALVVVGGFVYFAYWQTLLVRESRAIVDSLGRIEGLLAAAVPGDRNGGPTGDAALLATPGGTMLHRSDCPVVAGRTDARAIAADTPGFEACRICRPLS